MSSLIPSLVTGCKQHGRGGAWDKSTGVAATAVEASTLESGYRPVGLWVACVDGVGVG